MAEIVSVPEHGEKIVESDAATSSLQGFFDELVLQLNGNLLGSVVQLTSYTVASVPDATAFTAGTIFVSDETGGAVPAFSDGTDWRRVTDRAVIA